MKRAWWLPVALLVLLSFDVWNWNRSEPMLLFMPMWMWHVAVVTALFSLAFFLVARHGWREE